MSNINLNIHCVTNVRVVRDSFNDSEWMTLWVRDDEGVEVEITLYPKGDESLESIAWTEEDG